MTTGTTKKAPKMSAKARKWVVELAEDVMRVVSDRRVIWLNLPGDQENTTRTAKGEAHNEGIAAAEEAIAAVLRRYGFEAERESVEEADEDGCT